MSEEDYITLLDEALSQIPSRIRKNKRFELPQLITTVAGNRTFLYNFNELADYLKRDQNHLLKFFSGELATAGTIDGAHAVFQGSFTNQIIRQLLDRYVKDCILCPICHQADTTIVKKDRYSYLICEACGASSSLRSV